MHTLDSLLLSQGYGKTKFHLTASGHLVVKASINGFKGNFILDTGASNSCVGFSDAEHFRLTTEDSAVSAAGAGAVGMLTRESRSNFLRIGRWQWKELHLVVFDMSHVNQALRQHGMKPVRGIIGADVLTASQAVIDYASDNVYLKKIPKK